MEHDEALEGRCVLHLLRRHAVANLVCVCGVPGYQGLCAGDDVLDGPGDYLSGYQVDKIGCPLDGFELVEKNLVYVL